MPTLSIHLGFLRKSCYNWPSNFKLNFFGCHKSLGAQQTKMFLFSYFGEEKNVVL